jgi:hypothetical protein
VAPREQDRAIGDPVGLITDLITAADPGLAPDRIRSVVVTVAAGRAKSRRLAAALASRPAVLLDGRSPAPRAVGELLGALRAAGATAISAPCCAACGKYLQTFTRKAQDWYCGSCDHRAPCAGCGQTKRVKVLDRDGQPRCAQCCDIDDRDPISVIHSVVADLDPQVDRHAVAAAVDQSCRQRAYQQKLAWAIESDPALLTGEAHRAPLRVIPRFVERLHAAGVAGIVLPTCPGCHRLSVSTSRSTEFESAAPASRTPAPRNAHAAAPAANR